jgi:hypothetical protein
MLGKRMIAAASGRRSVYATAPSPRLRRKIVRHHPMKVAWSLCSMLLQKLPDCRRRAADRPLILMPARSVVLRFIWSRPVLAMSKPSALGKASFHRIFNDQTSFLDGPADSLRDLK